MSNRLCLSAASVLLLASPVMPAVAESNRFIKIAENDTGGNFFSQTIYAPPAKALVSWGTRTHAHKIRAHEVQHFRVPENRWIDAFPLDKADPWTGNFKRWSDREQHEKLLADLPDNQWVKMTPPKSTQGRTWGSAIFDTERGIAIPTSQGVLVYQNERLYAPERLYRFVGEADRPETWGWEEIEIVGDARPRRNEHMTIVHDEQRERLVLLSASEEQQPELWFFSLKDRRWIRNPEPASGGVSTREAVYVPDQDAILAYGPARGGDPVRTRVYLCADNRWVDLKTETPQYTVHEVAMEYDPMHRVAVLLWPPRFERDIEPHLLRLNVKKAVDDLRVADGQ